MVFTIYFLENMDELTTSTVINTFRKCFNIDFLVKTFSEKEIEWAFNRSRKQFNAVEILNHFQRKTNDFLCVVDGDIYVPRLYYVFGVAIYGVGAVISTYRFRINANERKFVERLVKTVKHEMGHYFGLGHCKNYCVMRYANNLLELDEKNPNYCNKCSSYLMNIGVLGDCQTF
ncbi:MAG: zinc-dependent metalloprotease family protein [Candidatus Njordarchaeia archaeon]